MVDVCSGDKRAIQSEICSRRSNVLGTSLQQMSILSDYLDVESRRMKTDEIVKIDIPSGISTVMQMLQRSAGKILWL